MHQTNWNRHDFSLFPDSAPIPLLVNFIILHETQAAWYTAPLKALVTEKFFQSRQGTALRVSQIVDDLYSHTRPDEGTAIPLPILVPEGTITSAHTGLTLSFLHRKEFGASNVGLLTGDASVNPTAPILCCTAEVLANASLRRGRELDCGLVVADEFHFYGDRDRGWAVAGPSGGAPRRAVPADERDVRRLQKV